MRRNIIKASAKVLLIGLYTMQAIKAPEKNQTAGYAPVLPENFFEGNVTKIQFYPGGRVAEGVSMERDKLDSGSWRVTSLYNA